jgi:argininosuccinate lyase
LVLWSTAEFGFIRLGDGYATGSSIMPQKRNPDMAELIRGKAGRVVGHLVGLLTILKGLPLAYNKDLQEDKEALFDAIDTVLASTRVTAEMMASAEPRLERMARAAGADFATATDYADYLAMRGVPFREAHGIVGALVQLCEARECDLADLTLEELRGASPVFGPDAVGLSSEAVVDARDVPGGTAPRQVEGALQAAAGRADRTRAMVARLRATLPSLDRLLADPLAM